MSLSLTLIVVHNLPTPSQGPHPCLALVCPRKFTLAAYTQEIFPPPLASRHDHEKAEIMKFVTKLPLHDRTGPNLIESQRIQGNNKHFQRY